MLMIWISPKLQRLLGSKYLLGLICQLDLAEEFHPSRGLERKGEEKRTRKRVTEREVTVDRHLYVNLCERKRETAKLVEYFESGQSRQSRQSTEL